MDRVCGDRMLPQRNLYSDAWFAIIWKEGRDCATITLTHMVFPGGVVHLSNDSLTSNVLGMSHPATSFGMSTMPQGEFGLGKLVVDEEMFLGWEKPPEQDQNQIILCVCDIISMDHIIHLSNRDPLSISMFTFRERFWA